MSPKSPDTSLHCAGCKKPLPKYEFLKCFACKAAYDLQCLNISSERYSSFYATNSERKNSWKCPECESKKPKQGNLNTPIRAAEPSNNMRVASLISPEVATENVTLRKKAKATGAEGPTMEDLAIVEVSESMADLRLLIGEMRAMRLEMSAFRATVADLTSAIKSQNTRLDNLEARIDYIEADKSERTNGNIELLEETILQLKLDIQSREQEMLRNDVEISNLPELANENPTHIFLTVAKKLGVELGEKDLVNVERAGPVLAHVEGEAPPRPRALVARLLRRADRDQLMSAARIRRGLTTEGMALPGAPRGLFVNERLTKSNRQLFRKTRDLAKPNWKYVWTRDGKIFARREQGGKRYQIRSDDDLARVFGTNTVSAIS